MKVLLIDEILKLGVFWIKVFLRFKKLKINKSVNNTL
jgi:hypothetical protein